MKRRMTKDGTVRAAAQAPKAGLGRRDFIKSSAFVAGMGVWVASGRQAWAVGEQSPSERMNIACIGIGGKGDGDSDHAAMYGNVVAIVDIDDKRLESKAGKSIRDLHKNEVRPFEKAKRYSDFRKMFDELGKDIDAVTISTPDHTHAVATMQAIKLGKHVYTQKPLSHDVYEARQLRLAAKEHKIASQMGNQGTCSSKFREGVETIRAGAIGAVKEVYIWTNRPIWPQAPKVVERLEKQDIPANIHWDDFLGTAPDREFNKGYQPFNWRGWWDFGTGALGDMGCHTANLPFMALKLGYPTSLEGEAGDVNAETYPSWARVVYEFPARGDMPPVKVIWHEGRKDGKLVHPPEELAQKVLKESGAKPNKQGKVELPGSGSIMVGEKGILYSPDDYGGSWMLLPKEDFASFKAPAATLPRNPVGGDEGQKAEWIAAAKGGQPALANFDYSGMLAEFILLGNIAIKNAGKKLEWDGPAMKFTNSPEADKLVRRQYRGSWAL